MNIQYYTISCIIHKSFIQGNTQNCILNNGTLLGKKGTVALKLKTHATTAPLQVIKP